MFKDWDGSSGAFLTFNNSIIDIAERLLRNAQNPKKSVPIPIVQKKPIKKAVKSSTKRLF